MVFEKRGRYERLNEESELSTDGVLLDFSSEVTLWRRRFFLLLACLTTALIASGSWNIRLLSSKHSCQRYSVQGDVSEPYSPASGHVSYENRRLTGDPDTPKFVGQPRQELDEAWHDLLQGTLIRVSEDELRAANATSIPLKDGGFGAGLGVSHSLHCLKRINQYFHKSHYYPGEDQDWEEIENHVDHCLESLRQSVLCQVDTSLYTLQWTSHSKFKPAVRVPQPHMCTNFNLLHDWMLSRAASLDNLVRPADEFFEQKTHVSRREIAISGL